MTEPTTRRTGCAIARIALVCSAVMFATTALEVVRSEDSPAGAVGTRAGGALVIVPEEATADAGAPLGSGGSATPFSLRLPVGSACPGDSAVDGWRVTSFMVPEAVDVSMLQFDPLNGPIPEGTGEDFRLPLFTDAGESRYAAAQTANAGDSGGPGTIVSIPGFRLSFTGLERHHLPDGTYTIGIACILGPPSDTQLANFWTNRLRIEDDPQDSGPLGLRWTALDQEGGGGATTTTTEGPGGSTTTTTAGTGGSTTSTTGSGGSTTSTSQAGSTTSTTSSGAPSTTAGGGGPSSNPLGGSLPRTGGSPLAMIFWGVTLLGVGRIAVVLGRPPKVRRSGA